MSRPEQYFQLGMGYYVAGRFTVEHAQRIATRYERTAVNFLAMLKLARIQRCLRLLDP